MNPLVAECGLDVTRFPGGHQTILKGKAGGILLFCYCQQIPWKRQNLESSGGSKRVSIVSLLVLAQLLCGLTGRNCC